MLLPACASPSDDTRTVCEWVLMQNRYSEAHEGIGEAMYYLGEVANTETSPTLMLSRMESALRALSREYDLTLAVLSEMRGEYRSPIVRGALDDMHEALTATQSATDDCVEILESAGGDFDKYFARESELDEATARMRASTDVLDQSDAGEQAAACAARLLAGMQ